MRGELHTLGGSEEASISCSRQKVCLTWVQSISADVLRNTVTLEIGVDLLAGQVDGFAVPGHVVVCVRLLHDAAVPELGLCQAPAEESHLIAAKARRTPGNAMSLQCQIFLNRMAAINGSMLPHSIM